MKTKFVVQIFLNEIFKDHRTGIIVSSFDDEWVRNRINLFERTTLRSLRTQSFKDFSIWMLCSDRNSGPIYEHKWPDDVSVFFDKGQAAIRQINADYLSITRIDSDDLYHRKAMEHVAASQRHSGQRECLIFRKNLEWDRPNRFVHPQVRPSPPFFTHIFPNKIFKDWPKYKAQHFVDHGHAGGNIPRTIELPANHACVVKHKENHRYKRRQKEYRIYAAEDIAKFRGTNGYIFDKEKIAGIMEDFAFPQEETLGDWQ